MTQPTEPKPYPPGPPIDRARVWRALDYRVDAAERAVIAAALDWDRGRIGDGELSQAIALLNSLGA